MNKKYIAITRVGSSGSSFAASENELEAINNCIETMKRDWGKFIQFDGTQPALVKTYVIPEGSTGWTLDDHGFMYFHFGDDVQLASVAYGNNIRYFR